MNTLNDTSGWDEMLMQVEKPARYTGGEINCVIKNPAEVDIRFAFCFPDVYEVGMSHLGMQILYYFMNRRQDTFCERVFSPWVDMEAAMRERNIPLFSLETKEQVKNFDFIGFTLQYEMSYTNVVNMLDLSGISPLSAMRSDDDPIVCAGGPCAYNPEPLADFIDFFYVGEGEVNLDHILDAYKMYGSKRSGGSKRVFLEHIAGIDGVYVPSLYAVEYKNDGTIGKFSPNCDSAPNKIKKVFVQDFDSAFYPDKQIVPFIEVVHDRITLEIFRGCIRGCRFCQAGFVYRPVREKQHNTLVCQAAQLFKSSGQDEVSLVSLSTSDYTGFAELVDGLMKEFEGKYVNLSLPSLRVDEFAVDIMQRVQSLRKSSLTFAPEAGTQRLRDVINKGLLEDDILNGCRLAFEGGWDKVKLYFMTGLPTETEEDLEGIAKLSDKIVEKYYELPKEKRQRAVNVNVSASAFVPKPFTPFQWDRQNTVDEFLKKQRKIKAMINKRHIKFNYHEAKTSVVEGMLARGDRRLGQVIATAVRLGCRFDGWTEHFKYELWEQAISECGLSLEFYTNRERDYDELLPWSHIDVGVSTEFLINERKKAYAEETTPSCREKCSGCGITQAGGICNEA